MASVITDAVLKTVIRAVEAATTTTNSSSNATTPTVNGQAGVLEGANPTKYSASAPITLFIIQAGIVIIFCQLLAYPLRWINQPKVIAEVIGGILLGPSVMMRIPGFEKAIFPKESMPVFNNVANLGLIIFLFLVALEVDMRMFTSNWKVALSVGLAGMILPFGLGFGIAYGLYHQFHNDGTTVPISFGVYGLFIGTALAITAFPVLCRILTELKLLRSNVGVTVLAAGIGNDVTGWVLLALCVALVNNNSGLAALWALLCCIGWILFLVFLVRPPFLWWVKRTGSLQNGPTQGVVALTLLLVLFSAFFTNIIGIHAIFGAFLVGLICPHEGGFAIKMTEKIEDLISVLFLPLYFALSGLSTNLGLLNDGITWGYVIGVIACAFAGKIIGGTLAARANKLLWRESFTIGCLMSCKGLVELIVLNIGLQAKILSQRTFTIFVVMALVTTVATTPLTKALYPPWYQRKVERWRRGEIDWDETPLAPSESGSSSSSDPSKPVGDQLRIQRMLVYLRLDSLPSLFAFITLLSPQTEQNTAKPEVESTNVQDTGEGDSKSVPVTTTRKTKPLEVHGLRLIELTDRTSSVMQVTEDLAEELYSLRDPVINTFRTFSSLSPMSNNVAVSGRVAVVPEYSYAETLTSHAADTQSEFALIPWSEYGSLSDFDLYQPLSLGSGGASSSDRFRGNTPHLEFIHKSLAKAERVCNAGVFIDNGFGGFGSPRSSQPSGLARSKSGVSLHSHHGTPALATYPIITDRTHHVFLPFIGGADDRVALRLVLQLASNANVTATVVHLKYTTGSTTSTGDDEDATTLLATLRDSLPADVSSRVVFEESNLTEGKNNLAETVLGLAKVTVGQKKGGAGDVVVVGRRHGKIDGESGGATTSSAAASGSRVDVAGGLDLGRTVGIVAEGLVSNAVAASVLVVQAGGKKK
ncbi:Sodium/hydrogen exchanger family-domain-containing protein [Pseudoneurospora amorphoporcata]|uniref:Sodium/hydrogen exchanger family-domain-containing protein n=1 Tax=Pseudoneurospora amorphoporcata TaxID=241081 RepID=A0AAN6NNR2_9PEZI|nr:Sodium/hydrogen exchanger family-domain-containing protein [Pseudoneurospora amorphoporcata]